MRCACEYDEEAQKLTRICVFHRVHLERDRGAELLALEARVMSLTAALHQIDKAVRHPDTINALAKNNT